MKKQQKNIFFALCVIMLIVNCFMTEKNLAYGIGISIVSILIWSCIGVIVANIGLFFYKIKNPSNDEVLSIWQKASLGLLIGIVLKPLLGIVW
jgi:hypothetical protein